MHLSELRLIGFKSFPRETRILFQPGITAIVGPNGCGKSNISDAIRWVLGEQGHRILRADRMEDIIFNGNGTFQPLGMAEVSLTITGLEGELPTEFAELNITRRLFRSGESQYLLNGAPCLLRDISSLFLDSGLGNIPYALIEQGLVSSLIDSKPTEKKAMIEEAAGVMRYKARRKAALTKLESAEQNLLRLQDVLQEVAQQRSSLGLQAKKAREYEELRRRMEDLQTYLRLLQIEHAEAEMNGLDKDMKEKIEARRELLSRMRERQDDLEREQAYLLKREDSFREVQRSLYQTRGEMQRLQAEIEGLRKEEFALQRREEKGGCELSSIERLIEQTREDLAEEEERLKETIKKIEELSTTRQQIRREAESLSARISKLERTREEQRREALQAAAQAASNRTQKAGLEVQKAKILQYLDRIKAQEEAARLEIEQMEKKRSHLQYRSKEWERSLKQFQARGKRLETDQSSLQEEEKRLDSAMLELQGQIMEGASRLKAYQEQERTHSGLEEGSRFLLEAATSSSPGRNREKVFQSLSQVLEAAPGCERAIEALLGPDLQGILIEDLEEARSLIDALKSQGKGGATLLPLSFPSSLSPREGAEPLPPLPGAVGWAIELVQFQPQLEALMRRLLERCLVVQDEEVALKVAELEPGLRFVSTLQGEVITPAGAIRLPAPASSGPLSRKAEMRELARKLDLYQQEMQERQAQREILKEKRKAIEEEAEALQQLERQLHAERISMDNEERQMTADWERIRQQEDYLRSERRQAEEEYARLEVEIQALEQEEGRNDSQKAECEQKIREVQRLLDLEATQFRQVSEREGMLAHQTRQLEEEKGRKEVQIARMEEQLHSQSRRREELEKELVDLRQERLQIRSSLEEKEELLVELRQQEEGQEKELAELEKGRKEAHLRQDRIQEELNSLRMEIAELESALSALRIEKAHLEQKAIYLRQGLSLSGPVAPDELLRRWEEEMGDPGRAEQELSRIEQRIRRLEPVNLAALRDYESLSRRYSFLSAQADDLRRSVISLRQTIQEIDKTSENLFQEAFRAINLNFAEHCAVLFGGGSGEIRLQREEEGLEGEMGVQIMVSPPGKRLANLSLLSGGEKALAGIAFLMALFRYRPSPFCLLDEADAPLDDASVDRFLSLLKLFSPSHQFILITHNKRTMEAAHCLYGVTMEEPGVSKVVSVRFDEAQTKEKEKVGEDLPR